MSSFFLGLRRTALVLAVLPAAAASAVTTTFSRNFETDTENRPFFPAGYSDGTVAYLNPARYSGTAMPGVDSVSMVTGTGVGVGGDDDNGVPMGVGVTFDVEFSVETVGAGHTFADGTQQGVGINSGASDPFPDSLSAGEQLRFGNVQVTNVSIDDPLGLLQPGAMVGAPLWKGLRGVTHAAGDAATTSSDAAQTQDVTVFDTAESIGNDYTAQFPPLPEAYLTTTAGDWRLKGIQYEFPFTYELAANPPNRRTFKFGDPGLTYDGALSHQITDADATISISAVGIGGALDTNDNGVGVNSNDDDALGAGAQRRIDGTLPTPEAIHFSFDRDVVLESITLGTLELDGTETVELSHISGDNPFSGLTGYAGDYSVDATSLTFSSSGGGQTPFPIMFGAAGQEPIFVEGGTVLALSSGLAFEGGFLLDMITVRTALAGAASDFNADGHVDAADLAVWQAGFGSTPATQATGDANEDGTVDGHDFLVWQREYQPAVAVSAAAAVPEPAAVALLLAAGITGQVVRRRRR